MSPASSPRKGRVLVLHLGSSGGGPQLLLNLSRELSNLRLVAVSYVGYSELAEAQSAIDVPQLVLGRVSRGGRTSILRRISLAAVDTWRLLQFCRDQDVECVVEVMDHPLQFLPRMALKAVCIPVVVSVHDAVRHAGEENLILAWMADVGMIASDAVLVYSAQVGEQLKERLPGIASKVVQTVHGAFGTPAANKELHCRHKGKPLVVGFFGRIERYKGIDRLISAMSMVSESSEFQLHVVGRGDLSSAQLEQLERLGASVRNEWIPDSEVEGIIQDFDILALPYDESSQSGVIGYAMSAGVPVVSTPVGGVREQVEESGAGLVASDLTPVAFADCLTRLFEDAVLYRQLSEAGQRAAVGDYSWARTAQDVSVLVSRLID